MNQHPDEPTTISGRPITSPVAFRLTLSDYERIQERAAMEGKTVAALIQEWVLDRLNNGPLQAGDSVRIESDSHPWNGCSGVYQGMEDTLAGHMHKVELDNGQSCFAHLYQLKESRRVK